MKSLVLCGSSYLNFAAAVALSKRRDGCFVFCRKKNCGTRLMLGV